MSDAHREEIAKLETLYAQNPQGRIFTHLAEAYRKAGNLDRARDVLEDGISRHPDYSSAYVVMGRVLWDQGRHDEARGQFRRVLELDGQNLVALRSLGDIARARGDEPEALDYYRRLLDYEPSDTDVRKIVDIMTGVALPEEGAAGMEPVGEGGVTAGEEGEPRGREAFEEELEEAPWGPPEDEAPWGALEDDAPWEPPEDEAAAEPAAEDEPEEAPWGPPEDEAEEAPWGPPEDEAEEAPWGPPEDEGEEAPWGPPEDEGEEAPWGPPEDEGDEAPWGPPEDEGDEAPWGTPEDEAPWGPPEDEDAGAGADWAVAGDLQDEWSTEGSGPEYGHPIGEAEGAGEGADTDGDETEGEDADVMTETIAQVYARQGLYDRAVEVYQELIRARPHDEGLRQRMAEVEALADQTGATPADEAGYEEEAGYAEKSGYPGEAEYTDEAEESGEDAAWVEPWGTSEAEEESPWEGDDSDEPWAEGPVEGLERDEAESAESDWGEESRPEGFEAAEAQTRPDQDVTPLEGLEAEEVEPDTGFVATPDSESEVDPWAEAGEEVEAPVESGEDDVEPEPWAAVEEGGDESLDSGVDGGETQPEPESPWMAETWSQGEAEAETPYAWAPEEEAEDGTPPIHAYLHDLLGWGGAGGEPAAEAEAAEPGVPATGDTVGADPAAAGEPGQEPGEDQAEDDDDDDDLEMFRSWLESLKE